MKWKRELISSFRPGTALQIGVWDPGLWVSQNGKCDKRLCIIHINYNHLQLNWKWGFWSLKWKKKVSEKRGANWLFGRESQSKACVWTSARNSCRTLESWVRGLHFLWHTWNCHYVRGLLTEILFLHSFSTWHAGVWKHLPTAFFFTSSKMGS